MARRYYSSIAARTTLSSGINASATSITVASTSGFPGSTPFTLVLDQDSASEELVTCTAVAGTTLTVTRGVDGTTATSHSAGAVVNHGVSARDFDEPNAHVNDSTTDVHGQYVLKSLLPVCIAVAVSDETTAITTGTAKVTFRMPWAMTVTAVRASLSTASTSGNPTFDINEGGTSILGANKLSIDANEKTSTTAATATTISDSALADDAEITIDIDTAGTGAKGAKVYLIGTKA